MSLDILIQLHFIYLRKAYLLVYHCATTVLVLLGLMAEREAQKSGYQREDVRSLPWLYQ